MMSVGRSEQHLSEAERKELARIRTREVVSLNGDYREGFSEKGCILIDSDMMRERVPQWLVKSIKSSDLQDALQGYEVPLIGGGTALVRRQMHNAYTGSSEVPNGKKWRSCEGGSLTIKDPARRRRIEIFDTRGFMRKAATAKEFSGTISELYKIGREVGLKLLPVQKRYSSLTRIIPNLITPDQVRSVRLKTSQKRLCASGPFISCQGFGRTEEVVYHYDLRKAYMIPLKKFFPELVENLAAAEDMASDSTAKILKVLRSAIIGQMKNADSPFYRPELAEFCYGTVFHLLDDAMKQTGDEWYRAHTDGFMSPVKLDLDPEIWKTEELNGLILLNSATWWENNGPKVCKGIANRANLTKEELVSHWEEFGDKPLVKKTNPRFSWKTGKWISNEEEIQFDHYQQFCDACPLNPAEAIHARYTQEFR